MLRRHQGLVMDHGEDEDEEVPGLHWSVVIGR